jgi:hypothetical protein
VSLRGGFFVGFLAGSVIATLLSKAEKAEAPASEAGTRTRTGVPDPMREARGIIAQVRERAREAMEEARSAAREREEELLRSYDEATRPRSP